MQMREAAIAVLGILVATAVGADEAASPRRPPSASEVLRSMSDFLESKQNVSVYAEILFDEVVSGGRKLQFAGGIDLHIARPDRMAINYRDDVSARDLWYDGARLTLLDPLRRLYATRDVEADLDELVTRSQQRLHIDMPLAEVFSSRPYEAFAGEVERASYIGIHDVEGIACHHLVMTGGSIDWQLWVELGPKPLLRKVVRTYRNLPESPQYMAVLMDWEFEPAPGDVFAAKLPENAARAEFLVAEEVSPR